MSLSISKRSASAPPVIAKVTESSASASVAAVIDHVLDVLAMVEVALDVKAGSSSLTSVMTVTVTVIVSSSLPASPSETLMTTTQSLASLPAPQPGVSKSSALLNGQDAAVGDAEQVVVALAALSPEVTTDVGEVTPSSASEAA